MKLYNPYYSDFENAVAKDDLNEIQKLLRLDQIRFYLNEEASEFDDGKYVPLLHIANDELMPLHYAAVNNFPKMVKILLQNSASINAQDNYGNTPLHLAAAEGNINIVQILLNNGAKSNVKNNYGNTPLHLAAAKQKKELKTTTVNIKNLVMMQLNGTVIKYSDNAKIIKALLNSKDTFVNRKNCDGYYPIHLAVRNNNLDAVEALLRDSNTDVNKGDDKGKETALMLAVQNNNHDMVELLLSCGKIDCNLKNGSGYTALALALMNSNCSDNIVVTLWNHSSLEDGFIIKLEQDPQIIEKLDRIKQVHEIDLVPVIKFIQPASDEEYSSESEVEDYDYSSQSEIEEAEIPEERRLGMNEAQPESRILESEIEEAATPAKRARLE